MSTQLATDELREGDFVETIKDERDIEVIPARTRFHITEISDDIYCRGYGLVYGHERPLHVRRDNLKKVVGEKVEG